MPRKKTDGLTPRELEIMQWYADGKIGSEIGIILGISVNTVAFHRARVYKKVGVYRTAHAVAECIRRGLIQ